MEKQSFISGADDFVTARHNDLFIFMFPSKFIFKITSLGRRQKYQWTYILCPSNKANRFLYANYDINITVLLRGEWLVFRRQRNFSWD